MFRPRQERVARNLAACPYLAAAIPRRVPRLAPRWSARETVNRATLPYAYPRAFKLSLRAKRGNLVGVGDAVQVTGLPSR
jgi:hypothetical protein